MNKEKLEDAKRLFFIALKIDLAVHVIVLIISLWSVGIFKDINKGLITDQSTFNTMESLDWVGKLIILTTVGVGLGLVRWLKTCYSYAKDSIGVSGFEHTGWITAGWLVPFLNLFKPYQVINEIYKAGSNLYATPEGWKKEASSSLLLGWWIFWVLAHLVGFNLTKHLIQYGNSIDITLQKAINAYELQASLLLISIAVSCVWFLVAEILTGRLINRSDKVRKIYSENPIDDKFSNSTDKKSNVKSQINKNIYTSSTDELIEPNDELLYEQALEDFESKKRRKGLWVKLLAKHEGNENKAKFEYIRLRVEELRHWEQASYELDSDRHVATWARAMASAEGDDAKTKALYIKFRAADLHHSYISSKSHSKDYELLESGGFKEGSKPFLSSFNFNNSTWTIIGIAAIFGYALYVSNSKSDKSSTETSVPSISSIPSNQPKPYNPTYSKLQIEAQNAPPTKSSICHFEWNTDTNKFDRLNDLAPSYGFKKSYVIPKLGFDSLVSEKLVLLRKADKDGDVKAAKALANEVQTLTITIYNRADTSPKSFMNGGTQTALSNLCLN